MFHNNRAPGQLLDISEYCQGCLSSRYERILYPTENYKDLILALGVKFGLKNDICWECVALMQKFSVFLLKVSTSQTILKKCRREKLCLDHPSLSTLAVYTPPNFAAEPIAGDDLESECFETVDISQDSDCTDTTDVSHEIEQNSAKDENSRTSALNDESLPKKNYQQDIPGLVIVTRDKNIFKVVSNSAIRPNDSNPEQNLENISNISLVNDKNGKALGNANLKTNSEPYDRDQIDNNRDNANKDKEIGQRQDTKQSTAHSDVELLNKDKCNAKENASFNVSTSDSSLDWTIQENDHIDRIERDNANTDKEIGQGKNTKQSTVCDKAKKSINRDAINQVYKQLVSSINAKPTSDASGAKRSDIKILSNVALPNWKQLDDAKPKQITSTPIVDHIDLTDTPVDDKKAPYIFALEDLETQKIKKLVLMAPIKSSNALPANENIAIHACKIDSADLKETNDSNPDSETNNSTTEVTQTQDVKKALIQTPSKAPKMSATNKNDRFSPQTEDIDFSVKESSVSVEETHSRTKFYKLSDIILKLNSSLKKKQVGPQRKPHFGYLRTAKTTGNDAKNIFADDKTLKTAGPCKDVIDELKTTTDSSVTEKDNVVEKVKVKNSSEKSNETSDDSTDRSEVSETDKSNECTNSASVLNMKRKNLRNLLNNPKKDNDLCVEKLKEKNSVDNNSALTALLSKVVQYQKEQGLRSGNIPLFVRHYDGVEVYSIPDNVDVVQECHRSSKNIVEIEDDWTIASHATPSGDYKPSTEEKGKEFIPKSIEVVKYIVPSELNNDTKQDKDKRLDGITSGNRKFTYTVTVRGETEKVPKDQVKARNSTEDTNIRNVSDDPVKIRNNTEDPVKNTNNSTDPVKTRNDSENQEKSRNNKETLKIRKSTENQEKTSRKAEDPVEITNNTEDPVKIRNDSEDLIYLFDKRIIRKKSNDLEKINNSAEDPVKNTNSTDDPMRISNDSEDRETTRKETKDLIYLFDKRIIRKKSNDLEKIQNSAEDPVKNTNNTEDPIIRNDSEDRETTRNDKEPLKIRKKSKYLKKITKSTKDPVKNTNNTENLVENDSGDREKKRNSTKNLRKIRKNFKHLEKIKNSVEDPVKNSNNTEFPLKINNDSEDRGKIRKITEDPEKTRNNTKDSEETINNTKVILKDIINNTIDNISSKDNKSIASRDEETYSDDIELALKDTAVSTKDTVGTQTDTMTNQNDAGTHTDTMDNPNYTGAHTDTVINPIDTGMHTNTTTNLNDTETHTDTNDAGTHTDSMTNFNDTGMHTDTTTIPNDTGMRSGTVISTNDTDTPTDTNDAGMHKDPMTNLNDTGTHTDTVRSPDNTGAHTDPMNSPNDTDSVKISPRGKIAMPIKVTVTPTAKSQLYFYDPVPVQDLEVPLLHYGIPQRYVDDDPLTSKRSTVYIKSSRSRPSKGLQGLPVITSVQTLTDIVPEKEDELRVFNLAEHDYCGFWADRNAWSHCNKDLAKRFNEINSAQHNDVTLTPVAPTIDGTTEGYLTEDTSNVVPVITSVSSIPENCFEQGDLFVNGSGNIGEQEFEGIDYEKAIDRQRGFIEDYDEDTRSADENEFGEAYGDGNNFQEDGQFYNEERKFSSILDESVKIKVERLSDVEGSQEDDFGSYANLSHDENDGSPKDTEYPIRKRRKRRRRRPWTKARPLGTSLLQKDIDKLKKLGETRRTESEENEASPENDEEKTQVAWRNSLLLVCDRLRVHKYAADFLYPVKESKAPHYYSVIKRPMDLSTIRKHIKDGVIRTTADFERDLLLMISNAIMYNSSDCMIHFIAKEFLKEITYQVHVLKTVNENSLLDSIHERKQVLSSKTSMSTNKDKSDKVKDKIKTMIFKRRASVANSSNKTDNSDDTTTNSNLEETKEKAYHQDQANTKPKSFKNKDAASRLPNKTITAKSAKNIATKSTTHQFITRIPDNRTECIKKLFQDSLPEKTPILKVVLEKLPDNYDYKEVIAQNASSKATQEISSQYDNVNATDREADKQYDETFLKSLHESQTLLEPIVWKRRKSIYKSSSDTKECVRRRKVSASKTDHADSDESDNNHDHTADKNNGFSLCLDDELCQQNKVSISEVLETIIGVNAEQLVVGFYDDECSNGNNEGTVSKGHDVDWAIQESNEEDQLNNVTRRMEVDNHTTIENEDVVNEKQSFNGNKNKEQLTDGDQINNVNDMFDDSGIENGEKVTKIAEKELLDNEVSQKDSDFLNGSINIKISNAVLEEGINVFGEKECNKENITNNDNLTQENDTTDDLQKDLLTSDENLNIGIHPTLQATLPEKLNDSNGYEQRELDVSPEISIDRNVHDNVSTNENNDITNLGFTELVGNETCDSDHEAESELRIEDSDEDIVEDAAAHTELTASISKEVERNCEASIMSLQSEKVLQDFTEKATPCVQNQTTEAVKDILLTDKEKLLPKIIESDEEVSNDDTVLENSNITNISNGTQKAFINNCSEKAIQIELNQTTKVVEDIIPIENEAVSAKIIESDRETLSEDTALLNISNISNEIQIALTKDDTEKPTQSNQNKITKLVEASLTTENVNLLAEKIESDHETISDDTAVLNDNISNISNESQIALIEDDTEKPTRSERNKITKVVEDILPTEIVDSDHETSNEDIALQNDENIALQNDENITNISNDSEIAVTKDGIEKPARSELNQTTKVVEDLLFTEKENISTKIMEAHHETTKDDTAILNDNITYVSIESQIAVTKDGTEKPAQSEQNHTTKVVEDLLFTEKENISTKIMESDHETSNDDTAILKDNITYESNESQKAVTKDGTEKPAQSQLNKIPKVFENILATENENLSAKRIESDHETSHDDTALLNENTYVSKESPIPCIKNSTEKTVQSEHTKEVEDILITENENLFASNMESDLGTLNENTTILKDNVNNMSQDVSDNASSIHQNEITIRDTLKISNANFSSETIESDHQMSDSGSNDNLVKITETSPTKAVEETDSTNEKCPTDEEYVEIIVPVDAFCSEYTQIIENSEINDNTKEIKCENVVTLRIHENVAINTNDYDTQVKKVKQADSPFNEAKKEIVCTDNNTENTENSGKQIDNYKKEFRCYTPVHKKMKMAEGTENSGQQTKIYKKEFRCYTPVYKKRKIAESTESPQSQKSTNDVFEYVDDDINETNTENTKHRKSFKRKHKTLDKEPKWRKKYTTARVGIKHLKSNEKNLNAVDYERNCDAHTNVNDIHNVQKVKTKRKTLTKDEETVKKKKRKNKDKTMETKNYNTVNVNVETQRLSSTTETENRTVVKEIILGNEIFGVEMVENLIDEGITIRKSCSKVVEPSIADPSPGKTEKSTDNSDSKLTEKLSRLTVASTSDHRIQKSNKTKFDTNMTEENPLVPTHDPFDSDNDETEVIIEQINAVIAKLDEQLITEPHDDCENFLDEPEVNENKSTQDLIVSNENTAQDKSKTQEHQVKRFKADWQIEKEKILKVVCERHALVKTDRKHYNEISNTEENCEIATGSPEKQVRLGNKETEFAKTKSPKGSRKRLLYQDSKDRTELEKECQRDVATNCAEKQPKSNSEVARVAENSLSLKVVCNRDEIREHVIIAFEGESTKRLGSTKVGDKNDKMKYSHVRDLIGDKVLRVVLEKMSEDAIIQMKCKD